MATNGDASTTESSAMSPNTGPSTAVIAVISVVGFLLLALVSVVLIVLAFHFAKKRKENREKHSFKDHVDRVFSESLKQKGNAMLREDYERYALSDVSPLNNKPASRKQSETAAYDEVPYSPDGEEGGKTTDENLNHEAKERRRNFAESRSDGIDSGISSIASYGKGEPSSPVGHGSSYKILQQTPSVDSSATPEHDRNATGRRRLDSQVSYNNSSGEGGLLEIPVQLTSDSVGLTINEGGIDDTDGGVGEENHGAGAHPTNYARSNSSFEQTEEGITRL